jgi:hypothetical protein
VDSLLWFVVSLILLVNVVRWIHRHMHGIALLLTGSEEAALVVYALPLLPGVLLHELSHTLMAFVLRVRTSGLTVIPRRGDGGSVALGSVMVEMVDPVRASLIGLAPLLFGSGVVLLIGQQVFNVADLGSVLISGQGPAIAEAIGRLFQTPDAWLWLYLIFSISNAMLPSESDREPWLPVILFLVLAALLVLATGQGQWLQALAEPVNAGLTWLTAAFGITLAVDLPVIVIIALLERGSESISGKRVYYIKPGEDRSKRK